MKQRIDNMDAKLATPSQEAMRQVVQSLPDETVSLAWRSALNEKVLAAAKVQHKRRVLYWFLRPAAGLALAGAMAAVVLFRQPTPTSRPAASTYGVEAALIAAHDDATRYNDITGSGLSPVEVAFGATQKTTSGVDWTEVDVESL